MALQIFVSSSPAKSSSLLRSPCSPAHSASWPLNRATTVAALSDHSRRVSGRLVRDSGDLRRGFGVSPVRCSLDTVGPKVGQVTEVNKDTFWPLVKAAGSKVVVLDMYTQWCGPCKVMAPKYQQLSEKNLDVVFLKLDCNQENRPLAKELGIRVVPTFKILKDSKVVKEVTGAKFDDLVGAIEAVKMS